MKGKLRDIKSRVNITWAGGRVRDRWSLELTEREIVLADPDEGVGALILRFGTEKQLMDTPEGRRYRSVPLAVPELYIPFDTVVTVSREHEVVVLRFDTQTLRSAPNRQQWEFISFAAA